MTVKPKYYQEAERHLGMKEIPGKQNNQEILDLWTDAGIPGGASNDETPWCAAFVNGCLVMGNKPSTKSGLARSFCWDENKDKFEHLDGPEEYAIGVMKRGNSTWEGHVGFVADFDDKYVYLLGGNQKNAVNISRFPRASFSGPGVGFVKPKKDATDITIAQLKKDSRAVRTGTWSKNLMLSMGAAGTAAYNFVGEMKQFVNDNTGLVILGVLAVGVASVQLYQYFTVDAYKDGRYLPKEHE
jgi:uncharacterized protein (TIGR02594 family)